MESLAELLEAELEDAVQIKSKKSLHRYVLLLAENLVNRADFMSENGSIKSDIRVLAETMQEGFRRMDQRFEDVNHRFTMMFTFMTVGFAGLTILLSLFKFIM